MIRELDFYIFTTISTTVRSLREKKASSKDAQSAPKYPTLLSIAVAAEELSTVLSVDATKSKPAPSTLEGALASLSLYELSGEALSPAAESYFRPYLTRLMMISPLKKVVLPSFTEAISLLSTLTSQILLIKDVQGSWDSITEEFMGEKVLSWEYIFQLSSHLSTRKLHLVTRSFYLGVLHTLAFNLDLSLGLSLKQRGIPEDILKQDVVCREWLASSFLHFAWDVLKSLTVARAKIFSNRLTNVLQAAGNLVAEALYVDEQIKNVATLPAADSDPGAEQSTVPMQWCTTYGAVISTMQMELYLQLLCELQLPEVEEFDYIYWYYDYIYSTQLHALEKIRAQRLHMDILNCQEDWRQQAEAERLRQAEVKQGKKKKSKGKKESSAVDSTSSALSADSAMKPPEVILPTAEDVIHRGRAQLCRGIFRLALCCKQLGYLASPRNVYTSRHNLFLKRFGIFHEIVNPSPLTFQDFLNTINRDPQQQQSVSRIEEANDEMTHIFDVASVLQGAIACFQNARKFFDDVRKFSAGNSTLVTTAQSHAASQQTRMTVSILAGTGGAQVASTVADQALQLTKVIWKSLTQLLFE